MGWDRLTERLLQSDDADVVLTFEQIERIIGRTLPASARRHAGFWSNTSSYARAWVTAGFEVTRRGLLPEQIRFVRTGRSAAHCSQRPVSRPAAALAPNESMAAVLIGCVKSKRSTPCSVADLYVSPLFARRRAYAERRGVPWFVLSAEHGLLRPDAVVSPYDRALADQSGQYRSAWGAWVVARLQLELDSLAGECVEVHAGHAYVTALQPAAAAAGLRVVSPLAELRIGEQLEWYDHRTSVTGGASPEPDAVQADEVDRLVALLGNVATSRRLRDLPAADVPLSPGLYAWFVDDEGAAELSRGLGHSLERGLIYAGQAGATRWPSGRRSGNSLRSRVMGMHMRGSATMSTFRRTLAASLDLIADGGGADESRITAWMLTHLSVTTVAVVDADGLGRLEDAVLQRLDPPLNLGKMTSTPLRARLTFKRREQFGR